MIVKVVLQRRSFNLKYTSCSIQCVATRRISVECSDQAIAFNTEISVIAHHMQLKMKESMRILTTITVFK